MRRSALLCLLAVVSTGCGSRLSYVVMRSNLEDPGHEDRPEVTTTAEAARVVPRVRRVALRAPDSCASQGAAEATGSATNRGSIVQTDCGVEMAELERALTRAGYQVYSWKQIQSMSRSMPAEAAARQLGAEVLFQVNSLERVTYVPSPNARWNRGFYASNAQGEPGEPYALKAADLQRLGPTFDAVERSALTRLGAMLDLNAVATETGQTLWFYRRVRFGVPQVSTGLLLRRSKAGWDPVPAAPAAQVRNAAPVSQQTQRVEARPTQRIDAEYFELMRAVVAEFAGTFASAGAASQAAAGAPPPMPMPYPVPPPPPPPAP